MGRRKPKHPTSKLQIRRFRRNSLAVMRNSINIFIRAPNNPVQALEDDVMDVFDPVDIINDNDDINKDENDDREAECYPNRGRFLARSVGSHNMDTNFPSLSMPATNFALYINGGYIYIFLWIEGYSISVDTKNQASKSIISIFLNFGFR